MNLKNVLKTYSLLRSLSDDESALLETLRSLSDSEREQLVETMAPVKVATKKQQPSKPREYDSCLRCGTTKRDSSHKDQSSPDYHEFQSSKKSAHAQSLSSAIQRVPKGKVDADADDTDEDGPRCTFTMGDNEPCNATEHSPIHKQDGGYLRWHEFQNSKTQVEDVSSAVHAGG